jgi:hypothetical protein
VELDDSETTIRVNQPIECAFHEDKTVKAVALITLSRSPLNITNAAVVEDTEECLESEDEFTGKDDSVEVFRVVGQAGSLACGEVADVQLSMAAETIDAVVDGDAAAEGVEADESGVAAV